VLIISLFFLLSCLPESKESVLSLSLKVQSNNSTNEFHEPLSFNHLIDLLSSFWKKNTKSNFQIRSYSTLSGLYVSAAYRGSVYDPTNNQIVFVPSNQASQAEWHVYDCATQNIFSYPKPSGVFADAIAYVGGVYDPTNNQIVFVPYNQADEEYWHVYDCTTKTVLSYFRPIGSFPNGAYFGGVYDPINDQIVFVPNGQASEIQWHVYDCKTKTIASYPRPSGTFVSFAYGGGVYDPLNHQIVFIPLGQAPEEYWHVYDCATKSILSYPRPEGTLANQAYRGGVYDPINNQIVFVPGHQASQAHWHVYDCDTKTVLSYPRPAGTFSPGAYYGGSYDPTNNQIVFAPLAQATQSEWHTFQSFGLPQVPRQVASHYLFNKF
jgi:IS1 family transposase